MVKRIHFDLLAAAEVLCEERHYQDAARRLGISQGVLRKRIATLEDQLDMQLFNKHFKRAELTPVGRAFIELARSFINEIERLKSLGQGTCP